MKYSKVPDYMPGRKASEEEVAPGRTQDTQNIDGYISHMCAERADLGNIFKGQEIEFHNVF